MADIASSLPVAEGSTYRNIVGNSTGVSIKAGKGVLYAIMLNRQAMHPIITIYDNTSASGSIMFTFTCGGGSIEPLFLGPLDVTFTAGLFITISGDANSDLTILYR